MATDSKEKYCPLQSFAVKKRRRSKASSKQSDTFDLIKEMTSFDYQGSSVIRQFSISPVVGLSLSNFSRPVVYIRSENVPKLPLYSLVKKCDNAPKKYEQK